MPMTRRNVLVFPCGSEVGLEIGQALSWDRHVVPFGATSIEHCPGEFVYANHIPTRLPYITSETFIVDLNTLLRAHQIDVIFPALDNVGLFLAERSSDVDAIVATSSFETNRVCRSKFLTYERLGEVVPTPRVFRAEDVSSADLPVFLKPDALYGSQGTVLAEDLDTVRYFTSHHEDLLVLEYLPGREFTVDCFTDRHGTLRFASGRLRRRIKAGISVNSVPVRDPCFWSWAERIGRKLVFRGAWFFQVKENSAGELVLMEVATRIAGSSGLVRNRGVNLPLLTLYDACGEDVEILENDFDNEIDRVFSSRFRIGYDFSTVYTDFDDCLVLDGNVNTRLVAFLYDCCNRGREIVLLSRHAGDLNQSLETFRLKGLFDEIIHLAPNEPKSKHIRAAAAIFIDDSFAERREVAVRCGIPTFAPDAIGEWL